MTAQLTPVPAPDSLVELIHRDVVPLYKDYFDSQGNHNCLATAIFKAAGSAKEEASGQSVWHGRKEHPFDWRAVTNFQTSNEHHAACIHAKVSSTVGLGFGRPKPPQMGPDGVTPLPPKEDDEISKVDKVLNPLCTHTFQNTFSPVCEDFWQVGTGYMEVVRRGTGKTTSSSAGSSRVPAGTITGLHHLSAPDVHVYLENEFYEHHYEIDSPEGGAVRRFARFGDRDGFLERVKGGGIQMTGEKPNPNHVSEVIEFRRPSTLSRWYGFPDWLSAVALIELVQCLHQWKYDFFLNRGVPEFMLFILGQKLPTADWLKIETALKANIGKGNSHKSIAVNLSSQDIKIQLEKLGMDAKAEDEFVATKQELAVGIVTAHGVPPLLAGILIPGKLGASNELPNAIKAFQALKIGPAQRIFTQTLTATLGTDTGLGLTEKDFLLKTINDEIDLELMDTMSRMREPVASAQQKGRNLKDGVKD